VIRHRTELLTGYQDAAYAEKYRTAVDKLRKAESALRDAGPLPLTEAVARDLAKLMAYKDEYEVARFYSDPAFLQKLREQFDGEPGKDYQLRFHLAPPLLAKRDSAGHLRKKAYGPWMLTAFRTLAKLKGLRGTALDPFGRTAERRMERALVGDYLALVDEFCTTLSSDNLPAALELARLPEQVRGFGHVKEKSVEEAAARREELLARYRDERRERAAA
jgi:indolepyruvate ferredoxin oxidoreductase